MEPVFQKKTSSTAKILGKCIPEKLQCLQKHETIKFLFEIFFVWLDFLFLVFSLDLRFSILQGNNVINRDDQVLLLLQHHPCVFEY